MTDIYTWAYVNPTNVRLLDNQLVVDGLLFFNARALERAVLPGAGLTTGLIADPTKIPSELSPPPGGMGGVEPVSTYPSSAYPWVGVPQNRDNNISIAHIGPDPGKV